MPLLSSMHRNKMYPFWIIAIYPRQFKMEFQFLQDIITFKNCNNHYYKNQLLYYLQCKIKIYCNNLFLEYLAR